MLSITRFQAASAAVALGSFAVALGLTTITVSPDLGDGARVLAQEEKVLTDREVIGRPGRPVTEQPGPIKLPPRPIGEVPPIKIPPIMERPRHGNEGVGNGIDPDTPGHLHNGGNDDSGFTPGNPGAKN